MSVFWKFSEDLMCKPNRISPKARQREIIFIIWSQRGIFYFHGLLTVRIHVCITRKGYSIRQNILQKCNLTWACTELAFYKLFSKSWNGKTIQLFLFSHITHLLWMRSSTFHGKGVHKSQEILEPKWDYGHSGWLVALTYQ